MKHIFKSYGREAMTIIAIAAIFYIFRELTIHRDAIRSAVFSETGFIYICFLAAAIDLGLVIKIHYRMLVIRYHEKDTRIRLFQD